MGLVNSHLRVHARLLLLQLPQISPPPCAFESAASTLFESPLRPNGENQAVTPGGLYREYRELVVHKRMIQDCAAQMELICTGNQCALIRANPLLALVLYASATTRARFVMHST